MRQTTNHRMIPLALVHHANQYLITETYENREGISQIVQGYAAILHLHYKYGIPVNLHLSGTLIETIAWHRPEFFALVKELRTNGLLNVLGGTYSENVMPLFSASFNRRQLNEHLWLCDHHLGCTPAEVRICWIPERVWDTGKLAPVLTDPTLSNGGYGYVLLDSRNLYPASGSYAESPRAIFDSTGPYDDIDHLFWTQNPRPSKKPVWWDASEIYRIGGANGLSVLPISADLRYCIPPRSSDDLRHLEETISSLSQSSGENTILVYADDLEKTASVGGWQAGAVERYEAFLQWVSEQKSLAPVLLADWLVDRPPLLERTLETGTFFELAQQWKAGEDYQNWWNSAEWAPYRNCLDMAERAIKVASHAGADAPLLALAWKHLMASAYETAWHDSSQVNYTPAPWAKAVASHARSSLVIAAAARWFGNSKRVPSTQLLDIDQDGEDEVILRNEHLYAVITPSHGGRLVYLFVLSLQGGAMVIGNPTDDWNFQQELNRYMDWPPNHPGAVADLDGLHDRYEVCILTGAGTLVEMMNIELASPLFGTRKRMTLLSDAPALMVCYQSPNGQNELEVESCLSSDYYRLLREGRSGLHPCAGETWSGLEHHGISAWVGLDPDENTTWGEPGEMPTGHGLGVRLRADASHFHVLIGCGPTDDHQCQQLLVSGRYALHQKLQRQIEKSRKVQT